MKPLNLFKLFQAITFTILLTGYGAASAITLRSDLKTNEISKTKEVKTATMTIGEDGLITAIQSGAKIVTYDYKDGRKSIAHYPNEVSVEYFYDQNRFSSSKSSTGEMRTATYDRRSGNLLEINSSSGLKISFSLVDGKRKKVYSHNGKTIDLTSAVTATLAKTQAADGGGAIAQPMGLDCQMTPEYDEFECMEDTGGEIYENFGLGDPDEYTWTQMASGNQARNACLDSCDRAYDEMTNDVCGIPSVRAQCHAVNARLYGECRGSCWTQFP